MGDKLVSSIGEDLLIENYNIEETEELVDVYNFQVEDFHTYFVGNCAVWVHNRTCTSQERQDIKDHFEGNKSTDGVKPDGRINGCHEESRFLSELDIAGGDLTDNIQSVNGINPATGRTSGVSVTALDNSSKEWNFYIRDNKLITMYPSV